MDVEDLYALPLDEFTAARNALAKELAKAKDPRAAEVKSLAKPSVAAWAINQLARRRRSDVEALLDAGERLRQAQAGALGGGDPAELREALRAEREAVARLSTAAEEVLEEAGHSASVQTQNRISDTLRAAAVDDEGRELLAAGRLTKELEPGGGFDLLAAMAPAVAARAQERKGRDEQERKRDEERERRRLVQEASRRVSDRRTEARAAEKEARAAEAAARKAREAADDAARRLADAEAVLAELTGD